MENENDTDTKLGTSIELRKRYLENENIRKTFDCDIMMAI